MTPPPEAAETARAKLHHAIRRHFSYHIALFYKDHPEWMDDDRGRQKISVLLAMMHDILSEVERYEIEFKPLEIKMVEFDG